MIKDIKWWRWIGFFLAVLGAYILGTAKIDSQWIGWTICSLSCINWIFKAVTDKDLPRTLMEVMYLVLAIRGIIEWF